MTEDLILEDCAGFKNELMDKYTVINVKIARLESMIAYPANRKNNIWHLDREIRPFLVDFINLVNFNTDFYKETHKTCNTYFRLHAPQSPNIQKQGLIVEHAVNTIKFWRYLSNTIRNLKIITLTGE